MGQILTTIEDKALNTTTINVGRTIRTDNVLNNTQDVNGVIVSRP